MLYQTTITCPASGATVDLQIWEVPGGAFRAAVFPLVNPDGEIMRTTACWLQDATHDLCRNAGSVLELIDWLECLEVDRKELDQICSDIADDDATPWL